MSEKAKAKRIKVEGIIPENSRTVWSLEEAADHLEVGIPTLRKWLRTGTIGAWGAIFSSVYMPVVVYDTRGLAWLTRRSVRKLKAYRDKTGETGSVRGRRECLGRKSRWGSTKKRFTFRDPQAN